MAELDRIPQTQSVEIATVKLEDDVFNSIKELQQKSTLLISDFGQIYVRKKELQEELIQLETILEKAEDEFKQTNRQLKEIFESVDEKYPQARINLQDGTCQYQPNALSRKQMEEQQFQQAQNSSNLKIVKE